MTCPVCGSGDIIFFKMRDGVEIHKCQTCGDEFANV